MELDNVDRGLQTTLFVLIAGQHKQHTVCPHVPFIVDYVPNSAIQLFQS